MKKFVYKKNESNLKRLKEKKNNGNYQWKKKIESFSWLIYCFFIHNNIDLFI